MPRSPEQNAARRASYARARKAGKSSEEARNVRSANIRLEQFRGWSGSEGFPPEYLRQIYAYNRAHNRTRADHLGYRAFYWKYVHGLDDKAVRKALRDNDS